MLKRLALALMVMVVTASLALAEAIPQVVKGSRLYETSGTASDDGGGRIFAWTQASGTRNYPYVAFFRRNTSIRINPARTDGFVGTFDPGTDRLIYQEIRGSKSNVYLYDTGSRSRIGIPGINNDRWQWAPSTDTDGATTWTLYGENKFSAPSSEWRVYLYNSTTGNRRLLDRSTNRCRCILPGTVAYPWVSWADGLLGTVFRYNIVTRAKSRVVLPSDRDEYASAIASDGTVYVGQGSRRCGVNTRIYRVALDGTVTRLHTLDNGRHPFNFSVDETGSGDVLYFDRFVCTNGRSDIMRIDDADTASRTVAERIGHGVEATSDGSWSRRDLPEASPRG